MIFPDHIPVIPDTDEALLEIIATERIVSPLGLDFFKTNIFNHSMYLSNDFRCEDGNRSSILTGYSTRDGKIIRAYDRDWHYCIETRRLRFITPLTVNSRKCDGIKYEDGKLICKIQMGSFSEEFEVEVHDFTKVSNSTKTIEEIFNKLRLYECQVNKCQ